MPKKDAKKKGAKKDAGRVPQDAVEAVRAAVERTFQEGAHSTRERTRDLFDEIAAAATRVRQSFEEVRADDVKALRREVEALSRRVAALESAAAQPAGAKATVKRKSAKKGRAAGAVDTAGAADTAATSGAAGVSDVAPGDAGTGSSPA